MVPSLRFLPRWWVLVAVLVAALLGALLGLGLVAWLALQAAALLARSAPSETAGVQCPVAFPERGCPAVGQTLLALHCEAVNSTLFELYLSDLFATHMAQARNAREMEDDDGEEDEDSGDMLDGILERPDEGSAGPPVTDSSFVAQTQSAWRNQALRRERPRKSAGSPKGQQARGQRLGERQGRHNRRAPDTTTTMVCYLLVTLLVASAVLAVGEVLRDWWASVAGKAQAAALEEVGRPPAGIMPGMAAPPGSAAAAALAAAVEANRRGQFGQQLSRRCSLVDLTVSRHERRESMAAALAQAHGTHPNQASGQSHGQAGIGARPRPPPLSRRSSFSAAPAAAPLGRGPTACPSSGGGGGGGGGRPPGGLGERGGSLGSDSASPRRRPSVSTPSLSLDLSDGDSSPDTGRKRVRIIRRH